MDLSVSKYSHLKYTVKLTDFNTVNALTVDVPLDTLPPGAVIMNHMIKASTALSGGGTTAQTGRLKLNGSLIGAGTTSLANTTGAIDVTQAAGQLAGTNALALTLTVATANLNTVTAGQVDVIINYAVLAP